MARQSTKSAPSRRCNLWICDHFEILVPAKVFFQMFLICNTCGKRASFAAHFPSLEIACTTTVPWGVRPSESLYFCPTGTVAPAPTPTIEELSSTTANCASSWISKYKSPMANGIIK